MTLPEMLGTVDGVTNKNCWKGEFVRGLVEVMLFNLFSLVGWL